MNNVIQMMIDRYQPRNNEERKNALKEIIQQIALAGLSHGDFFSVAGFYGGTCLRLFYGLDRFSEDLDFALIKKPSSFNLEFYFPALKKEFASFGIGVEIEQKVKVEQTDIQSAFIKSNALTLLLSFFPNSEEVKKIVFNDKLKIKFEIDVNNPAGFTTRAEYQLLPSPYEIRIFDEASLFSGKITAILCREYKRHVKGRDFYDYLFLLSKGSKINLSYLENKLKATGGKIRQDEQLTLEKVKQLLKDKFEHVDYEAAKEDVANFIKNKQSLSLWKKDFFLSTIDRLQSE